MTPSDTSTSSPLRQRLLRLFREKDYRRAYVESFLNTSIAAQIKANREMREWNQTQLADLAGMKQSRISTMENVNYGSWSIRTLKQLAEAFDLVLVVRFESFGNVLGDIVNFNRENLERLSFEKEGHQEAETPEPLLLNVVVDISDYMPAARDNRAKRTTLQKPSERSHG